MRPHVEGSPLCWIGSLDAKVEVEVEDEDEDGRSGDAAHDPRARD